MAEALRLARDAGARGEIPVGALLVHGDRIVGRGGDEREGRHDPTAHAEVMALREAAARLRSWRLPGSTMYVTLEPCIMCVGAILGARVERVVYGAASPKSGGIESLVELASVPGFNHRVKVRGGVRDQECRAELEMFFGRLRRRGVREAEGA